MHMYVRLHTITIISSLELHRDGYKMVIMIASILIALMINSESTVTAMVTNSETLSTGVLAVIITIPSLLALVILIVLPTVIIIILIYNRRSTKQGTQAEACYSTVGPPLPPAKLEKNVSYEGSFGSLRIIDKEQCHHDTQSDDSDQFYEKITEKCMDTSIHHQPIDSEIVTKPVNETVAHCPTNTATAMDPEILTEENVAYSQKLIDTNENIA